MVAYNIYGTILTKGGNPVANTPLTITNTRTGDTDTSVSTNGDGEYTFDCDSFENGYENNDYIQIDLNPGYDESDFDIELSADNGVNWEAVSNGVIHTFVNTGKELKIRITSNEDDSFLTRYEVYYI